MSGPVDSQLSSVSAAVRGRCPRCGNAPLFSGFATFAPNCHACGLDYSEFNVGDGPAAFLTLLVGALITGLAIALELAAEPPWWVHVILWLPLTTLAVTFSLRIAKAMLLALEYRHRAREGQISGE
jgi:uncharacterized protein (DUF983 family)